MEDLSSRTAQEVLDDHLNLAEDWGAQEGAERIAEEDKERAFEEDIRRNVSEDIVILINRGTFQLIFQFVLNLMRWLSGSP